MDRGLKLDEGFFDLARWIVGEHFHEVFLAVGRWFHANGNRLQSGRLKRLRKGFEEVRDDASGCPNFLGHGHGKRVAVPRQDGLLDRL